MVTSSRCCVTSFPTPATALELATRISDALSGPVILQGVSLHVEASVGIALSPTHADEVDVLLQRADVALYQAKAAGPGSVVLYDPSYRQQLDRAADTDGAAAQRSRNRAGLPLSAEVPLVRR